MKKMLLYLLIFLLVLCVVVALFLNLNPTFGGNTTKAQKEAFSQFDNYIDGKFVNTVPTNLFMGSSNSSEESTDSKEASKEGSPTAEIPVEPMIGMKLIVRKIV
ncbi:hypothetical protein [Clostridium sp.]|uniref:hypothetical protein n=1 Tax=Clostridium sp. TaxID=1506 RepID=UPI002FC884DB